MKQKGIRQEKIRTTFAFSDAAFSTEEIIIFGRRGKNRIKIFFFAYNGMMLIAVIPQFYKVKRGQTVKSIAEAFSLPECAIIGFNDLKKEVWEGQILHIPALRGNLYTVCAGDSKELLSGSRENFERRNLTSLLYPGMKVLL